MRFRTPSKIKASPIDGLTIPMQQYRPNNMNIQQARGGDLQSYTPSPEQFTGERPPYDLVAVPNYPSQELLEPTYAELKKKSNDSYQDGKPLALTLTTKFGFFTFMVLAFFSMHLVNFATRMNQKSNYVPDNTTFLRDNSHRTLLATRRGTKSSTFFMGDRLEYASPSFAPVLGRKLVMYPSEYSDVTQLYDKKSSGDTKISDTMEMKFFPLHETKGDECVPMYPWQTMSFPTCNNLHEVGILPSLEDDSLRLLSSAGSWRDAWRFKASVTRPLNEKQIVDNVIVKTIKFQHTLQDRYFEFSRVDALSMERLTSSPYVMGVYNFCGVSVVTERGVDDIALVADKLSSRDKVEMAKKVARSIAAVHEIDAADHQPAALVHNDINTGNLFLGRKNTPMLNDFNIAVLMMKDRHTNQTCSFPGHFPNAQWKAPEEQVGPDGNAIGELTEKVDIYALGNILFRFATGKGPWREMADNPHAKLTSEQKAHIAELKINGGRLPEIPEKTLRLKDPYINLILEAMEMCYSFKPEDRPTAREVANFFEDKKKELDTSLIDFGRFPKQIKKK